eukprot:TRINITY_DN4769_c0_g1_i1.p1 TRINITY_DN4769_c0_g1~~TRINITY_DN4769_c0_g1_i1.p1  ORF type:complete len:380 (+),score=35.87 TRINITY_DN4769_c0_g1_i1:113-1252(+)
MEQLFSSNSVSTVATILATLPSTVDRLTKQVQEVKNKIPDNCRVLRQFDTNMITEYIPDFPIDRNNDWYTTIGILDVESTGLRKGRDEAVELSIVIIDYSAYNSWEYVDSYTWKRKPSIPMSLDAIKVTGITDNSLIGDTFDGKEIINVLDRCHVLVAHNAKFDFSMLYKGFGKKLHKYKWLCSLSDIPWTSLGFYNKSLKCLCYDHNLYTDNYHSSVTDSHILAYLLTRECKSKYCDEDHKEESLLWEDTKKVHTYMDHLIHDNNGVTEYLIVKNFPYNYEDLVHGFELTQIGINKWDEGFKCWWTCRNHIEIQEIYENLTTKVQERYPGIIIERYEIGTVARLFNPSNVITSILKNTDINNTVMDFQLNESSEDDVW